MNKVRCRPGDVVRVKHRPGSLALVLEVASGGARLRYMGDNPPFGSLGQRLGVWEHLVDVWVDELEAPPPRRFSEEL